MKTLSMLCAVALLLAGGMTAAEERWLLAPASQLEILEGQLPDYEVLHQTWRYFGWSGAPFLASPYAMGDAGEEIYVCFPEDEASWDYNPAPGPEGLDALVRLVIRTDKPEAPTGRLFFRNVDGKSFSPVRFRVKEGQGNPEAARTAFFTAKARYYERMLSLGIPGAAWFRHEAREARTALGQDPGQSETPATWSAWREGTLEDTFSLFTGGRALSENLQLDRELRVNGADSATVPISGIDGITVKPIDWTPLTAALDPEKDPLAMLIPADQHALFFPSFQAMLDLMDEAKSNGTPILRLFEPRGEDAHTQERYERQLCLAADDFTRLLGPKLILSVACTGSDPYLRTGSDVAFLFETDAPDAIAGAITARQETALATTPGGETVSGNLLGVNYKAVVTPTRSLSSYLAVVGHVVIVTNSPAQLERILAAAQGAMPNMASLGEYVYFRNRYKRGADNETALLVVTDGAIRRWCGPQWRIAASRRTRAAAVLADQQAVRMDELATGGEPRTLEPLKSALDLGELKLTADGVQSSIYGTLDFQTPIAELSLDKVTEEEQTAYAWFRDSYQNVWRAYFDPIAVRFSVQPGTISADLTVQPLILDTEYRRYVGLTGNRVIKEGVGDPHDDALGHIVLSIDPKSEAVKPLEGMAMFLPNVSIEPFQWLGEWGALYIDRDPMLDAMTEAAVQGEDALESYLMAQGCSLPIALHIDSTNPLSLAAFLTGVRAFIEQSAPGMLTWEPRDHKGQAYVKVRATDEARSMMLGQDAGEMALYYAPAADALVASLNEGVIQRALERRAAAKEPAPDAPIPAPWLGESMAMRVGDGAMTVLQALLDNPYHQMLQERAWGGIPILNEWKRRYGVEDPIAFHEQHWGARITCPGGGEYVWNEVYQTMESTVYGCPAAPKMPDGLPEIWERLTGGDFGVTFEDEGLRARATLTRKQ